MAPAPPPELPPKLPPLVPQRTPSRKPAPRPPSAPSPVENAVANFDPAPWSSPVIQILYGVTFDLTGDDPYQVDVEEAYEFPQTVGGQDANAPRLLGYCVAVPTPQWSCPLQDIEGGDVRLNYSYHLAAARDYSPKGVLYEEFVLGGKDVWVLVAEGTSRTYRPLNRFLGLHDSYTSDGSRMTTIHMRRSTFVDLDRSQREANPTMDIIDYPGIFIEQPLSAGVAVITRVNPRIPGELHWLVQKLLSAGVGNLFLQWLLLGTGAIAPPAAIGALIALLRRKKAAAQALAAKVGGDP